MCDLAPLTGSMEVVCLENWESKELVDGSGEIRLFLIIPTWENFPDGASGAAGRG